MFPAREMEFSLPQDGSFVVSWDINEKSRYGVGEGDGERSTVAAKRPGYINCQ